jgi:hypothetical protein
MASGLRNKNKRGRARGAELRRVQNPPKGGGGGAEQPATVELAEGAAQRRPVNTKPNLPLPSCLCGHVLCLALQELQAELGLGCPTASRAGPSSALPPWKLLLPPAVRSRKKRTYWDPAEALGEPVVVHKADDEQGKIGESSQTSAGSRSSHAPQSPLSPQHGETRMEGAMHLLLLPCAALLFVCSALQNPCKIIEVVETN